ncbi:MAG: saccharopine dehydrogenase C-terminal domain-containing protein [Acidobacteriota bacterium]
MKILVFGGSGAIGKAVAWDLVQEKDVEEVGIVGRREIALKQTRDWIGSKKIKPISHDILNQDKTKKLMEGYDVGVIALPDRKTSYGLAHSAVEAGLDIVDMLEEYHRKPDLYETEGLKLPEGMSFHEYGEWLHRQAEKNGVIFLDGMGFAPGLSNITVEEGIRKLNKAESAVARVGGIPSKEASLNHPLRYMITWAFEHVLREYMVKLNVIKDGQVVEVEAMSDRERFLFDKFGKNEELVCAVTPGMPSFIYTRPQLKEFAEKTIRWPGHWEGIQTLKECGLLDLKEVQFDGQKIKPREFLLALIVPRLKPRESETDVCVMWNTVKGEKDGRKVRVNYYMWDQADSQTGLSAMARTTGFPVAAGALFLGRKMVKGKGIVAPEDGINGPLYGEFMKEMKKRNIQILEEVKEDS